MWGVEGAGGLPVRRHSYGGHRVELWKASDWLKNDKKQLKVKQSAWTNSGVPGLYPGNKNRYFEVQCNALLDQWQGSLGALFA